ncbi:hypothetical protein [Enterococcus sp. CWB-B31]|nr:hypothetical protein [Enterococcus sp. CWB-B31]
MNLTATSNRRSIKNQAGIIYSDRSIVVIYDNKAEYPKIVKEHYS